MDVGATWVALVVALFGGAGLKGVEYWLSKDIRKETLQSGLRAELRDDLKALRKERDALDKQVDRWRDRYYGLLDFFMTHCRESVRGYLVASAAEDEAKILREEISENAHN